MKTLAQEIGALVAGMTIVEHESAEQFEERIGRVVLERMEKPTRVGPFTITRADLPPLEVIGRREEYAADGTLERVYDLLGKITDETESIDAIRDILADCDHRLTGAGIRIPEVQEAIRRLYDVLYGMPAWMRRNPL